MKQVWVESFLFLFMVFHILDSQMSEDHDYDENGADMDVDYHQKKKKSKKDKKKKKVKVWKIVYESWILGQSGFIPR